MDIKDLKDEQESGVSSSKLRAHLTPPTIAYNWNFASQSAEICIPNFQLKGNFQFEKC